MRPLSPFETWVMLAGLAVAACGLAWGLGWLIGRACVRRVIREDELFWG